MGGLGFILLLSIGLIFIVMILIYKLDKKEPFINNDTFMEYIKCLAFDREYKEENDNIEDNENDNGEFYTVEDLANAPFLSFFIKKRTVELAIDDAKNTIRKIAQENNNDIYGPIYTLLGKDKDVGMVILWIYMPGYYKDKKLVTSLVDYYTHNIWIEYIFITNKYNVSREFCRNPCNVDDTTTSTYNTAYTLDRSCGCVSKNSCSFYLINNANMEPRKIMDVNSYTLYKVTTEGIKALNSTYTVPSINLELYKKNFEYVNCIALNHIDPKDDSDKFTNDVLTRAPCWSYNIKKKTMQMIIIDVINKCGSIAEKNNNILKGPIYIVMGRNKNDGMVDAWVYMPSIYKNESIINKTTDYYSYHGWIRRLLFTDTFSVSHWYCNNPCNNDRPISTNNKSRLDKTKRFMPGCGCISNNSCPFYYVPGNVNMKTRKSENTNTYSVYKINPDMFSLFNIKVEPPFYVDMDQISSGSTMHSGCDNRLVSKNRKHSFEITDNGFGFYDAKPGTIFREGCYPMPNTAETDNTMKVQKEGYNVTGILPRFINNDEDISVYSIVNDPKDTKKKWLVKQLEMETSGNYPYIVQLNDNGKLEMIDSKGVVSDAIFKENVL